MSTETSLLFRDYTLGPMHLKNRIVMAPLTRSRASRAGVPPEYAVEYYSQRAGAGLIVSEATNISPQAIGYAFTPGIWSKPQVESWKRVTRAVHDNGGLIVLQLWHTGRISHPDLHSGAVPVSASAIKPGGDAFTYEGPKPLETPRALETHEIPGIVEDYRHASPASMGWRCIPRTTICWNSSFAIPPTSARMNTAVRWRTGCAFRWRR